MGSCKECLLSSPPPSPPSSPSFPPLSSPLSPRCPSLHMSSCTYPCCYWMYILRSPVPSCSHPIHPDGSPYSLSSLCWVGIVWGTVLSMCHLDPFSLSCSPNLHRGLEACCCFGIHKNQRPLFAFLLQASVRNAQPWSV